MPPGDKPGGFSTSTDTDSRLIECARPLAMETMMHHDDDPTTMSVQQVRKVLKTNPYRGFNLICCGYEADNRRRNEQLYDSIGLLAEYVITVERSEDEKKKLFDDPYWDDKPYGLKPDQITLICTMRMLRVKAAGSAGYQTARDYARCIESLLDDDVAATDIADKISGLGGIKGVLRHYRVTPAVEAVVIKDGPATPPDKPDVDDEGEVDDDDDLLAPAKGDKDDHDQRAVAKARAPEPSRKSGATENEKRPPQPRRTPIFKAERDMAVEAGLFFERFFRMPIGSEVQAVIVRRPDDEGIPRFQFLHVGSVRQA